MKIHLGCGKRDFGPDWDHIDGSDFQHLKSHDIVRLPYPDNSVDLIYASHVFEYFDRIEAKVVLQEWHRVLRPGGVLRLAVPDFAACAHIYLNKGEPLDTFVGMLYGRWKCGDKTIYHRTVYDFDSLRDLLAGNGFRNYRRWDWRAVDHGKFDDHSQAYMCPDRDRQNGNLVSLNVQVEKQ